MAKMIWWILGACVTSILLLGFIHEHFGGYGVLGLLLIVFMMMILDD